ncbi:MAG: methionyl-tRNA formyltransferase [Catonella sp.]|uniref:methionyl-tRNA formyltransferase n=1 Tax=Catonella sp. TaxID=2382125 RepID=UPI003F9FFD95
MKIIFMGTPDFAEASLAALIGSEHEILAVVTQPDKPKGRKGELTPSPVKILALENNLTVHQPVKVREPEFVEMLKAYNPDVIVVVAFGQIIPESILNIPKYGCVNIHGSLLPKYRGAAPIQWAVLDGEKETGITSMLMDKGLDTGDMLLKKVIPIAEDETSGSLFEKMMALGADTLLETLKGLEKGEIEPEKQGESPTNYAKMLTKSMGLIDFTKSAYELDCFVRGMNPWPSAYTVFEGKTLKIWKAKVLEEAGKAGSIARVNKDSFVVYCGRDALEVLEVQLEGKKRMSAGDFLKGTHLETGQEFGGEFGSK